MWVEHERKIRKEFHPLHERTVPGLADMWAGHLRKEGFAVTGGYSERLGYSVLEGVKKVREWHPTLTESY